MRSRSSASRPTSGVNASGMVVRRSGAVIASRPASAGRVERSVLGEDRRLQLPELMTRFEPELVAQNVTTVLEDAQRVGLPTGPVQREHQQAPQPLAQRMRRDELLELDDHALVTTERELEVEPLLDHREPQLGQPGDGRRRELLVGEVGEGIAPPQRIRLGQQRDRAARITVGGRRLPGRDELLVPVHVDGFRRQLERVAAAAHRNELGRAERPAQLRREPLETVAHRRGRILTPQRVDDLFRRNDSARRATPAAASSARSFAPATTTSRSSSSSTSSPPNNPTRMGLTVPRRTRVASVRGQLRVSAPAHLVVMTTNAIEQALLAVMAANGGDTAAAQGHISRAQRHARATARRERQVVEIAALVVADDGERAAGLTLEHTAEFPDDADLLARISAKSAAKQQRRSELST